MGRLLLKVRQRPVLFGMVASRVRVSIVLVSRRRATRPSRARVGTAMGARGLSMGAGPLLCSRAPLVHALPRPFAWRLGDLPRGRALGIHGNSPYSRVNPRGSCAHRQVRLSAGHRPAVLAAGGAPRHRTDGWSYCCWRSRVFRSALRLLGVRDWRCYSVAVRPHPRWTRSRSARSPPFLLLGAAAVWRYRDRPLWRRRHSVLRPSPSSSPGRSRLAGRDESLRTAAGDLRRLRSCCSWAAGRSIDFAGLRGYPTSSVSSRRSRRRELLGRRPAAPGRCDATVVTGGLVLGVVIAVVRSRAAADGDRRSFAVAVVGALLATPVLWLHYLVLLFVPIALASRGCRSCGSCRSSSGSRRRAFRRQRLADVPRARVVALVALWSIAPASGAAKHHDLAAPQPPRDASRALSQGADRLGVVGLVEHQDR